MARETQHIIFPGDPEYDRPNSTRDWHYAITIAVIPVIFFSCVVWANTQSSTGPVLTVASLLMFIFALVIAPPDPRYP